MYSRLRLLPLLLSSVLFLSFFAACRSAQKYVESGNYDEAVDYCVDKLRGKRKKKTEYVQALELAFQKAQARDLLIANHLANENRPENWERVNGLHRRIRARQNKVSPLTPLVSVDGYRAKFDFVDIETMESESRRHAAENLYTRAEDLLRQADNGDRPAARQAYRLLEELEDRYYRQYRDKDQLKNDARALGTTHILFEVKNQSDKVLPRDFQDRILAFGTRDLDSDWKVFHFKNEPGTPVDYRVVFNVRRVDISPERISERAYTDEADIRDGWDYVLDARGNVKKDSAGNDIKVPRYARVRAFVLEACQTKATRLAGTLDIVDAVRNTRLDTRDFNTEILFENYAATFTGDARALSDASRKRIGNRPVPFPPDEDMLVQAAERLKPGIREELRGNRSIL